MFRYLLFFGIFKLVYVSFAQDFYINRFRAADGLDTDMIKCVTRDKYGFIWIGSDDGIIQYDGISFTRYPESTESKYVKDLLNTQVMNCKKLSRTCI
jgi:ligand-binding sensor domain-containing protein